MRPKDIPFYYNPDRFGKPIRMPTTNEVQAFADRIGARFPEQYVSLIVERAGHIFPTKIGYPIVELTLHGERYAYLREPGILFHFDVERDFEYSIQIRHRGLSEKYGTQFIVPICTSDVNEYSEIAFDYRNSRIHPMIIELDYDNETLDHLGNPTPVPIADSFPEFIDKLMTEEEFEAKYGSMMV